MKMQNKLSSNLCAVGIIPIILLTACADWQSEPVVVDDNFGYAVRSMVKNQTLYPEHGQNDDPLMSLDGQKAEGVIEAYRSGPVEEQSKAKERVELDVDGR